VNNLSVIRSDTSDNNVVFTKENWFSVRKSNSTMQKLSYIDFIKELEVQIKNDVNKHVTNFIKNLPYQVNTLEIVITNSKYDSLKINSEYLPILTYHITTSTKNVNSILNNGYLLPNSEHPISNQKIKMANGNFFGTGIYSHMSSKSATFFGLFASDDNLDIQLIVNLVDLKQPHIFKDNLLDKKVPSNNNIIPYYLTPDANGIYSLSLTDSTKTATSLILFNDMIVTGSPSDIIPVCVVTLSPVRNPAKIHQFKLTDKDTRPKVHKSSIVKINAPTISAIRICDDMYMLTRDLQQNNNTIPDLLYYYAIPDYFLTLANKSILEQYMSTKSNGVVYTYGEKGYSVKNNLSSIWCSENFHIIKNTTKQQQFRNNIYEALEHMLKSITNSNKETNVIYLFSNSLDTSNLIPLITKYSKILKFKRIVVKVITLNNNPDNTMPAIQLKYYLQTESIFDNAIYALEDHNLASILQFIDSENVEISGNINMFTCDNEYFGSGFIVNLHQLPEHSVRALCPIYKGAYQKYFHIDGNIVQSKYVGHITVDNLEANIFGYEQLINLLCSFRNYILINPKLITYYSVIFNRICITTQENLKAIATFILTLPASQNKVNMIKNTKQLNFRLNKIISDIITYTKTKINGKWYNELINLKFSKQIIKRTSKHAQSFNTTQESLCNSDICGIGICCVVTNAATIEPWMIKVQYVSEDTLSLGDVFTRTELGQNILDSKNNMITDVMFTRYPVTDEMMKMYYSYVFTRNIYTFLPTQPVALLTNAWISLLENFFKTTNARNISTNDLPEQTNRYQEAFDKIWNLFDIVKTFYQNVNTAFELEYFNRFITSGNNELVTFNQLVGLLLRTDIDILTDDNFVKCFVETITRSTKAYVKSCCKSGITITSLISDLFSIDMNTNLDNYTFNVQRAVKVSGKFYKAINLSCTPFSFVAMWEFFKAVKNSSKTDIFNKFINKEISMRNCLKYFGQTSLDLKLESSRYIAQIALYLHSLKCCLDKQYKIDSVAISIDCNKIIEDAKANCIQNILTKRALLVQQSNKRIKRLNEILIKGQEYTIYHKTPIIFTHKQIAEMNLNRPKDDQLELTQSGLLKHHCCYPDCPKYLCNFETTKDKTNGKRYGLMHHLKYDVYFNNYFPAMHAIGKQIVAQVSSLEDFVTKMITHYKKTRYSSSQHASTTFIDCCENIYKFYQSS